MNAILLYCHREKVSAVLRRHFVNGLISIFLFFYPAVKNVPEVTASDSLTEKSLPSEEEFRSTQNVLQATTTQPKQH